MFINDLPEAVNSQCQLYADDTKLYSRTDKDEFKIQIQQDLDNLVYWADTWQLKFNAEKCHVLHLGYNNPCHSYYMKKHDSEESVELAAAEVETDLGVHVDKDLCFTKHIDSQVCKANRLVGLIRRSFTYMDKECMKQLFTSLVRPHLEYANVAWSPHYKRDIDKIEKVQRRATKFVPELKHLSYEERLKAMKLPSLQYRRKRGDLIEVYKYTHGFYNVNKTLLQMDNTSHRTRGHALKLAKQNCRLDIRKHFFSLRVVNDWNNLPPEVVDSSTLNCFKSRLDNFYADEIYLCAG